MDFRIVLSVLLTAHFLGDFYFQSDSMAASKNESWRAMLAHGLVYWGCVAALTLPILAPVSWLPLLLIPALHLGIDSAKKWALQRGLTAVHPTKIFFADQFLHLLTILVVAWIYATKGSVAYSAFATGLRNAYANMQMGMPAHKLMPLLCVLLFVWKPAGVMTARVLEVLRKHEPPAEGGRDQNAGRYIGILERFLSVLFFLTGQYTAIAFTLTAKSVARFKELEKADFAEQYLVGTLTSQLLAIVSAAILCG